MKFLSFNDISKLKFGKTRHRKRNKLSHFPPCDFFFVKKSIEAKWQDEWSYRTEVHLYGLTLKAKQVFDLWYTA